MKCNSCGDELIDEQIKGWRFIDVWTSETSRKGSLDKYYFCPGCGDLEIRAAFSLEEVSL